MYRGFVFKNDTLRIRANRDYAVCLPFCFDTPIQTRLVAVFAHIFYVDLCEEIKMYLNNIPCNADVFISTDTMEKSDLIKKSFYGFTKGKVTVLVCCNRGRDIAPRVVGFKDVYKDYEIFLHIHSKKSLYNEKLDAWREYSFRTLLGSSALISNIIMLLETENIGIVFPQHFEYIKEQIEWGDNYKLAQSILAGLDININKKFLLEFPSGSMFWGKTKAIEQLLNAGFEWEDFPVESGQVDGTMAHAIERMILYIAEFAGFKWIKISTEKNYSPSIEVCNIKDVDEIVRKAHRPVLKKYC